MSDKKVIINRVYTRTGDEGLTSVVFGSKVSKSSDIVNLVGDLDELNSYLGLLSSNLSTSEILALILEIQNRIFDIGALLAGSKKINFDQEIVDSLERYCDQYNDNLPELTSFVLPGGSKEASICFLARAVCRRAERGFVKYIDSVIASNGSEVGAESLHNNFKFSLIYLNRLSDLLFIISRYLNISAGNPEILWK